MAEEELSPYLLKTGHSQSLPKLVPPLPPIDRNRSDAFVSINKRLGLSKSTKSLKGKYLAAILKTMTNKKLEKLPKDKPIGYLSPQHNHFRKKRNVFDSLHKTPQVKRLQELSESLTAQF